MVCGSCNDFKIQTLVPCEAFGDFESGGFGGESAILEGLKGVEGVSGIETQTITHTEM